MTAQNKSPHKLLAVSPQAETLLARLPEVRGRYVPDAPLADICWFKVGGAADVLYTPADAEDLAAFLRATPADVPLSLFGGGSNVLVRDGGVRGVSIRLAGKGFSEIRLDDDGTIYAGCATPDVKLARAAADWGRAGLAFYRGIPGTVGGAIAMNAGAYGGETADALLYADALNRQGLALRLTPQDLQLSYRHNGYGAFAIYIGAAFHSTAGDATEIRTAMDEISTQRSDSQPVKARTGGSTFKNPATPPDTKAWQLIDRAGCRGLQQGGAQISEQHCNFLINHGDASADDLESLGETARARVLATSGVALEWEIHRMGERLEA